MQIEEAIETRRAVKQYDDTHVMPEADFQRLIHLAMLAPTSFNIQHWRFVRITDPALRQQLREAAWNQEQVTSASELLIITGNTLAWQQAPERYWKEATPEIRDMLVNGMTGFYQGRPEIQRDEAIRSGAMAAQNIMLAAKSMGYDTNPMIGFDATQVASLIKLPEDHVIVMMLVIGKAISPAWPRGGQLSFDEVVIENHFS